MFFYRIDTNLIPSTEIVENNEEFEVAGFIQSKTDLFFNEIEQTCHIAVSNILYRKQIMILCIASKEEAIQENTIIDFLNLIDFKCNKFKIREITMNSYISLLRKSSRNDFISAEDDILKLLNIDRLNSRLYRNHSFDYSEDLLYSNKTSRILYEDTAGLLCSKSLSEELDRIFVKTEGTKNPLGHPVHYMFQIENRDSQDEAFKILHSALYLNKRITSQRYSRVTIEPYDFLDEKILDTLFDVSIGGTIILSMPKYFTEGGAVTPYGSENVVKICDLVKKYRNRVLTIIDIPHDDNILKESIIENLGSVITINVFDETAFEDRAKSFLRELAKKHNVKPNKSLYRTITNDKGYSAADLNLIFDEWYGRHLKNNFYTQYADLNTANKQVAAIKPKGNAFQELSKMIGLEQAKLIIKQAIDFYKAQKLFREKGLDTERPAMHMVFTGNPGTAKTTVARLFAQIMKDNNLLSIGDLYEVGRADLVDRFLGGTAPRVKAKFKAAKGSVLFIDEAYSLYEDRTGLYGDEAINTIVQEMENHRDDMIVIFAGYPNEMEKFLLKNPGLRSRIAFHVSFDDYTAEELFAITELMANNKKINLAEGTKEKLLPIYETALQDNDFGNGRFVRNLFEKAKMNQATRLVSLDPDVVTKNDVMTLLPDDFVCPEFINKPKRRIGFGYE